MSGQGLLRGASLPPEAHGIVRVSWLKIGASRGRLECHAHRDHRMVDKIIADRKIGDRPDSQLAQMVGGPDPGAHQNRGRMDRAHR